MVNDSLTPSNKFVPISSNVTSSTLLQSTKPASVQEMVQMITQQVLMNLQLNQAQKMGTSPKPGEVLANSYSKWNDNLREVFHDASSTQRVTGIASK